MFISDIAVAGYQSLYKVGLTLGNFTVIYGESDVGKSALYRALRAFITCESGDSFISHGETKTGVVIRLVTGERIAWIKKKGKSAEYRCGDKLWRRNRALPPEVAEKLQIHQLTVDNEKFYPNLRGQFDSLFLLFESSAKRARVLGSLISNILLQGIRKANTERNRNEADVRALENLIAELDKRDSFSWKKFLIESKGVLKVLETTLKGVSLHTQLSEKVAQWETSSRLSKFSVDTLPKKFFTDLDKLVKLHSTLSERHRAYVLAQCGVEGYKKELQKNEKELDVLKVQLAEVKKKLMVTCPRCKAQISLLELRK